jgi:hypothetical protein
MTNGAASAASAIDRHPPLGLRAAPTASWWRPADLGQEQVGEDRPRPELELALSARNTDDPVTSDGIRSGVNWMRAELHVQHLGERPGDQRFGQPG